MCRLCRLRQSWAVSVLQVMAPLLDHNHELNWQANMVNAIEKRQSTQHTEGSPLASSFRKQYVD